MKKGEKHNCLEFDLAYASKAVIKLRNGKWARVVATPFQENSDVQNSRYMEIERCPWCNTRLSDR